MPPRASTTLRERIARLRMQAQEARHPRIEGASNVRTLAAGDILRNNAAGVGEDVGGILSSLPGMMNTVVGSFKTDSVGVASVEQVGVSKVTNVGATQLVNVGKHKKTTVGEEFVIEVGASKFIMRQDGTVIILGTNFNFTASGPVQINGVVVDLNKPGS